MTIIRIFDEDGILTMAVLEDDKFALRMLERFKLANTNNKLRFNVEHAQQELSLEDIVGLIGEANEG